MFTQGDIRFSTSSLANGEPCKKEAVVFFASARKSQFSFFTLDQFGFLWLSVKRITQFQLNKLVSIIKPGHESLDGKS